jgi:guanylate kinase
MGKKEKICILGGSASGKDYLLKGLINKGERYSPKVTTRPMRQNEINGVDYFFTSNDEFNLLLNQNKIKTYQKFVINGVDWYYGITTENFENNNIFIMTPHELSQLSTEDRKNCFVVWLAIDDDIRRKRLLERNDNNDSIDRRINADNEDFKDFNDYDMKLTDDEFEINLVYDFAI